MFLAGFLAPRACWLLGVIVGLVAAACYSFLVLTVFSGGRPPSHRQPALTQDVVIVGVRPVADRWARCSPSAAAWYRRFLTLSNPNRGPTRGGGQAQRHSSPTGKLARLAGQASSR